MTRRFDFTAEVATNRQFPRLASQAFHLFMHFQDYRRVCFQQAASISSELGVNMGERRANAGRNSGPSAKSVAQGFTFSKL